jgi:hypothetical protein
MSIFLQNFVQVVPGRRAKPLPPMFTAASPVEHGAGSRHRLSYLQIVIMVV